MKANTNDKKTTKELAFIIGARVALVGLTLLLIFYWAITVRYIINMDADLSQVNRNYLEDLAWAYGENISNEMSRNDNLLRDENELSKRLSSVALKNRETSYAYIMNGAGVILYHPDSSKKGDSVENKYALGLVTDINNKTKGIGQAESGSMQYSYRGIEKLSGSYVSAQGDFILIVVVDYDEIRDTASIIKNAMIIFGVILSLVICGINVFDGIWIRNNKKKKIAEAKSNTNKINHESLDNDAQPEVQKDMSYSKGVELFAKFVEKQSYGQITEVEKETFSEDNKLKNNELKEEIVSELDKLLELSEEQRTKVGSLVDNTFQTNEYIRNLDTSVMEFTNAANKCNKLAMTTSVKLNAEHDAESLLVDFTAGVREISELSRQSADMVKDALDELVKHSKSSVATVSDVESDLEKKIEIIEKTRTQIVNSIEDLK